MSGMTAFMIAVGGTSLICYLLMTRVQNRSARRTGVAGDGPSNGGGYDSGGDGWSVFSWFSGGHSTSDHCGGSSDSGGGDCGGGDGGGGGGGDGGGGD
jgi:hypothetical protein